MSDLDNDSLCFQLVQFMLNSGLVVNGAVLGQTFFGRVSGRIFCLTLKDLLSQFVSGQHTVLVQQPLKSDLWF